MNHRRPRGKGIPRSGRPFLQEACVIDADVVRAGNATRFEPSRIVFVTSSPEKMVECHRLGLGVGMKAGWELADHLDAIEVAADKARLVGEGRAVADSLLEVEGVDIGTNVRWFGEGLRECPELVVRKAILSSSRGDRRSSSRSGERPSAMADGRSVPVGDASVDNEPVLGALASSQSRDIQVPGGLIVSDCGRSS